MKGYTYPGKSPIKVEVIGTSESGAAELSDPKVKKARTPSVWGLLKSVAVLGASAGATWGGSKIAKLYKKRQQKKQNLAIKTSMTSKRRGAYSDRV